MYIQGVLFVVDASVAPRSLGAVTAVRLQNLKYYQLIKKQLSCFIYLPGGPYMLFVIKLI